MEHLQDKFICCHLSHVQEKLHSSKKKNKKLQRLNWGRGWGNATPLIEHFPILENLESCRFMSPTGHGFQKILNNKTSRYINLKSTLILFILKITFVKSLTPSSSAA